MLTKRVIPCLDVHDGKVTRGVQFGRAEEGGLRNVGDPVELAVRYNEQGADEMVFFDITASAHGRDTMIDVIERTAAKCFMPLTVGGGIREVSDMHAMLRAGADKVSINSSALATPELITAGAARFGSQCIVVSIDAKKVAPDRWEVFAQGGRKATGLDAVAWAEEACPPRRRRDRAQFDRRRWDQGGLRPRHHAPDQRSGRRPRRARAVARARCSTWSRCWREGKADAVLAATRIALRGLR